MDNAEQDIHQKIDEAMADGRWQFAYQLAGDALKADHDDYSAALKRCQAKYQMGDYVDALPITAALCLNVQETIADTKKAKQPVPAELAIIFVESRAMLVLCQLRSAGGNKELAMIQLYELHRWLYDWEESGILAREASKPLLRSLETRLGLG